MSSEDLVTHLDIILTCDLTKERLGLNNFKHLEGEDGG